jgi:hypothetical protein
MGRIVNEGIYTKITALIFVVFTAWWLVLQFFFPPASYSAKVFGALYGVMALLGGFWSLNISKKWGGYKSLMGRAILMFGIGLLMQEFGQICYSYYNYILHLDPPPYPAIGDIGFFGSIPFYAMGAYILAKASGVKIGLQSFLNKLQAIAVPAIMLIVGYSLFLKNCEFDWSNPLKILLDFGYPLGQAIYVSFAMLTFLLTRGVLGGIMKLRILFILLALCMQFLSDYTFLYQTSHDNWFVGGINDYMYFIAYFLMTLALLELNSVYSKLKS